MVAAAALIAALVAWSLHLERRQTYRYKLSVEVDTKLGLRSGSAVREVKYNHTWPKLPDMAGATAKQRGEAVIIDLPGGETLFALMPVDAYRILQAAFGDDSAATLDTATAEGRVRDLDIPTSCADDDCRGFPRFVTFTDPLSPTSMKRLNVGELVAGSPIGVSLKRVTVQMVEEEVTRAIAKRLPWLTRKEQFRTVADNPFTSTLPPEVGSLQIE